MKTSLVQLRIGDSVIYEPDNRKIPLIIDEIKLVPNGINDPKLVAVITAKHSNGFRVEATSDKFIVDDQYEYNSIYNEGLKLNNK